MLRIELGKYYLNGVGDCVGPMRRGDSPLTWLDHLARPYFQDGRAQVGTQTTRFDLVREWVNPEQSAAVAPIARQQATRPAPSGNVPPPIPPQFLTDPEYAPLFHVLQAAHEQAAHGKGKERHANGRPFDRQPIMELGRMYGPGFAAGQAAKKSQEAMGMIMRGNRDAAIAELLGSINYLAACVMLVREQAA